MQRGRLHGLELLREKMSRAALGAEGVLLAQLREAVREHVLTTEEVVMRERERVDVHVQLISPVRVQRPVDEPIVKSVERNQPLFVSAFFLV